MNKSILLTILLVGSTATFGQDIQVTFTGIGASTTIDSITATNLQTNQRVTFPGSGILTLKIAAGLGPDQDFENSVIVYPNPFTGRTTLSVNTDIPQMVNLEVFNLVGQSIAQARTLIQPGQNEFAISINTPGIYLVDLVSDHGRFSKKLICTYASVSRNSIEYLGSAVNKDNDLMLPGMKNLKSGYFLDYTVGDILYYRCRAGIYTTILTDSPITSKNYPIEFVSCTDPDGKSYAIVGIGTQTWMVENLAWLPSVSGPGTGSLTNMHYYVYGYEGPSVSAAKGSANYSTYGVLYNWEAAKVACPEGWHLPSDSEWMILEKYLGMSEADTNALRWRTSEQVGGKLKESGTGHWMSPNNGATNATGFTALPSGIRNYYGGFYFLGSYGHYWSSTERGYQNELAWERYQTFNNDGAGRLYTNPKNGYSVRCVRGPAVLPSLTTSAILTITDKSAITGGFIASHGGASITARGVCWSTSDNPTIADNRTSDGTDIGKFSSQLTGLTGNTEYYFRAYAQNAVGVSYGNQSWFSTLSGVDAPVETMEISSVNRYTATGGGHVLYDGGSLVSARGVCWSIYENPTIADNKTSDGTGSGIFTSSLSGLTANTKYFARAYAQNAAGLYYGKQISFTTMQEPVPGFTGYLIDSVSLAISREKNKGIDYWENTAVLPDLMVAIFQRNYLAYDSYAAYCVMSPQLCTGDFNLDGYIDVFNAGHAMGQKTANLTFLLWDETRQMFYEKNLINDKTDFIGAPGVVVSVYLNDDDYVDMVIFGHYDEGNDDSPYESVSLCISDGKGGYDLTPLKLEPTGGPAYRILLHAGDIGDLNGDGLTDMFICSGPHTYILWGISEFPYFSNTGYAHFHSDEEHYRGDNGFGESVPEGAGEIYYAHIADVNGDGLNDILLGSGEGNTNSHERIMINKGGGRFNSVIQLPDFPNPEQVGLLNIDYLTDDFNGDGLNDVIAINTTYKTWSLVPYIQKMDGTFTMDLSVVEYMGTPETRRGWRARLAYHDFDGDGEKDIVYLDSGISAYTSADFNDMTIKSVFIRSANKFIEKDFYQYDRYAKSLKDRYYK